MIIRGGGQGLSTGCKLERSLQRERDERSPGGAGRGVAADYLEASEPGQRAGLDLCGDESSVSAPVWGCAENLTPAGT